MSTLSVTLLDVGWGDSIFLESIAQDGSYHFALIDSNDSRFIQRSMNFLKRYFRRHREYVGPLNKPYFDFVLLTHNHEDHASGLKNIIKEFGSKDLFYPHSKQSVTLGALLSFANRQVNRENGYLDHHEAIEVGKPMPKLGDAEIEILWPPEAFDYHNEDVNDTSVVLSIKLGKHPIVLTGDAEKKVWDRIASKIPRGTRFFKVPHHGSVNGTFTSHNRSAWYESCYPYARLGISGDVDKTWVHPDKKVIELFERDNRKYYRTDENYHITFKTNGSKYDVKYSHY
jgi:competence protein ComEC